MNVENNLDEKPPRRKSLWPWLLLLFLTLLAIYSWNRANEIFEDFSRNMPAAMIELFRDLLNEHDRDGRSGQNLDVVLTIPVVLR